MANWNIYRLFKKNQFDGTAVIDFDLDTLKIALVTNTYTPSTAHDFFDDITNEISGASTNYTSGGETLTSVAWTNEGDGTFTLDAANPTWLDGSGGTPFTTARRAILYKSTGTPGTSPLVAYSDAFAADKGNDGGDLTLDISAGIFTVS